jgi:TfoX N-terminal domain
MFGGLAFLWRGNMCCGVLGDRVALRLGPKKAAAALGRPHVRPMDFTGRVIRGMVFVEPRGYRSAAALQKWIDLAREFASTLPAK